MLQCESVQCESTCRWDFDPQVGYNSCLLQRKVGGRAINVKTKVLK